MSRKKPMFNEQGQQVKHCSIGKHFATLDQFRPCDGYNDGLYPYCYPCKLEDTRRRRAVRREINPNYGRLKRLERAMRKAGLR